MLLVDSGTVLRTSSKCSSSDRCIGYVDVFFVLFMKYRNFTGEKVSSPSSSLLRFVSVFTRGVQHGI